MISTETDKSRLRARQDSYLANHYVGLHNMVVSVALAVAGVAAASLVGLPAAFRAYAPLLWIMLAVSLLAVTVAYAGTVTGAPFLPARLPAMPDLALPLLLALNEFFLFGVLAHQVSALSGPQAIVRAWFIASASFGVFASLSIWRARSVVKSGQYSEDIVTTRDWYVRRLTSDTVAALSTTVVSLVPVFLHSASQDEPSPIQYVMVGVLALQYCGGFVSHSSTRKHLMAAIQSDV